MNTNNHTSKQLSEENTMTSKRIIINEDGGVELPKQTDAPSHLELIWDGRAVTSIKDRVPESFLDKCQDTLKSHSPIVNVISTELAEDIEKLDSHFKLPALWDPRTGERPKKWSDNFNGVGDVITTSLELEMVLPRLDKNLGDPRGYEKLYEKIVGRAITSSLLEDFAAKLNKDVKSKIMEYAYPAENVNFSEIIRKRSAGEYSQSNPHKSNLRSYGTGTKIMLHPLALELIPGIRSVEGGAQEASLGNIPLCLNWDMPVPSDDTAEVLIGNFSEFIIVLEPIKLFLKNLGNSWKLKAETQALCGLWSLVSLGFAKAKIEVKE